MFVLPTQEQVVVVGAAASTGGREHEGGISCERRAHKSQLPPTEETDRQLEVMRGLPI